jgi:hypothetical protein
MSAAIAPSTPTLGRREFLAAGLATGAVLAGALGARLSGAAPPASPARAALGDGHVDDAWGHWPPYAHPIPYGDAQFASTVRADIAAADAMFMI